MTNDDPIERVTRPRQRASRRRDPRERESADLNPDARVEMLEDRVPANLETSNLLQELQLEDDHGGNKERVLLDRRPSTAAEQAALTSVQPGDDVRIEIDQGFHSLDQSM